MGLWKWILAILFGVFMLGNVTGCTPAQQLEKIAQSPAFQETLKDWQTNASYENPNAYGEIYQGFRLGVVGARGSMDIRGDATAEGIDPDRLERLHAIAEKYGVEVQGLTARQVLDAIMDLLDVSTNG